MPRRAGTASLETRKHICNDTREGALRARGVPRRDATRSEDPYVVGVQQNPDGTTTMFFGIITPPQVS